MRNDTRLAIARTTQYPTAQAETEAGVSVGQPNQLAGGVAVLATKYKKQNADRCHRVVLPRFRSCVGLLGQHRLLFLRQ